MAAESERFGFSHLGRLPGKSSLALPQSWLGATYEAVLAQGYAASQESFKIIGSVGMVKLLEPEDEKDEKYFDKFEAQILVKFRDGEPLQVLNPQRQSGGERSVSTMLFMISLQDLTACPFRVVDEINQGMDPKNERRIFQEMVLSSSQPKTAQCFLLTPKLLQQLDYGEHTTILNIMSGKLPGCPKSLWKYIYN